MLDKDFYSLEEIADITFFSLSKVKYIISKMKITPTYIGKYSYYTCYQVELIQDNDWKLYEEEINIILNSKMNKH